MKSSVVIASVKLLYVKVDKHSEDGKHSRNGLVHNKSALLSSTKGMAKSNIETPLSRVDKSLPKTY